MTAAAAAVPFCASGQQATPSGGTDRSVWFNYFGDQPFTHSLALHLEGSYRRTLGLGQFEQSMLRPGITVVESPHWQSLVAYSYFRAEPTDGGSFGPGTAGHQTENRLFEQEIFTQRVAGRGDRSVTLEHRVRLEQRWITNELLSGIPSTTAFSERVRYRLTAHVPVGEGPSPVHYVACFNEIYTGFGPHAPRTPFYADVTYGAFGTKLNRCWSIEVGYQYRRLASPGGVTGLNDSSVQFYVLSTAPLHREGN